MIEIIFHPFLGQFDCKMRTNPYPEPCADERLVDLDLPVQHPLERSRVWRQPDPVPHKPRGFLRDPEGTMNLVAADAVLGVHNQPGGHQPLVQADVGVLEDRAGLD